MGSARRRDDDRRHPADDVLDAMRELCELAAEGVPRSGLRSLLVSVTARVLDADPVAVLDVAGPEPQVLVASRPTRVQDLGSPVDGWDIPEDAVTVTRGPGHRRVAVTRLHEGDDGARLLVAVLRRNLDGDGERALRVAAKIAGQAIAVATARAHGDRAQRMAERLIDAGMSLASHLTLDELLERLVLVAREVLEARYAALGVLNPARTKLERFVTSGLTEAQIAAIGPPPHGRGVLGILITDPRPIRGADISMHPDSCGFPPGHPPMRSFLGVPVMLRGEAFGNLYVTEKVTGAEFTEDDVRLAQTLAAQAAVAVDNARRYETERLRLGELRSVQEVAEAILSTLDLEELLPLIARRARRLTGADTVGIALREQDTLRFRFAHGQDAHALESLAAPGDPVQAAGFLQQHLDATGVIVEPLEVGDDPVGALAAVTRSHMDATARRLLSTLASQASIAVANAETFAAERRRLRESAQVQAAVARASAAAEGLRKAIQAQEAERARVARELHDEAGQSLTALALNLRMLDDHLDDQGRLRLSELRQMVNGISGSLRSLATDLRPSGLKEHGLASAIERQGARLREATGMAVDVVATDLPDDLPEEVQIALFRVVQEALTNVARHSGAGQASVVVSRHGGHIRVMVEDDGRGFDTARPSSRLGLPGIRERVELIGGTLRIESIEGAGTALIVDLEDPR